MKPFRHMAILHLAAHSQDLLAPPRLTASGADMTEKVRELLDAAQGNTESLKSE